MNASDLFVKSLEQEGVKYIFGIPGEENLDLLNSLKKSKIKIIITRHEQAAGFMAATYGRLTGRPGVCLSTLGPGATNLVTAAAHAQLGAMPMVMITGQKPIKTSKQGRFQVLNIIQMMKPLTKRTKQVVHGNAIPTIIRELFRVAEEERPGTVHIELPEDVAREKTTTAPIPTLYRRRPVAEEKAIFNAIQTIKKAKRPLILIGAAANRKMVQKMLREFIDKTGIYFCNTQMGKGVVDERHKKYLGTAALSENDYVHVAIKKADLIINIGHDIVEKPPFFMTQNGIKVLHVNYFSAHIDEIYFPQHEVVGDIANALWQIKEGLDKEKYWDFSLFKKIKNEVEKHLQKKIDSDKFPLIPQRIVNDVRKEMPEDGIICLDNGMYKIWFARNYKAYQPNTLLLDNALATMGAGLPSAITASLLNPKKKVMAICGDGGFMMNSQELETAVRLKLNLIIIILQDNSFGMIKWKQEDMGLANFGLDFNNPDFVKYAESYGANGVRIKKANDLSGALKKCLKVKGVHVIEVPIDYSENEKVFNRELKKQLSMF